LSIRNPIRSAVDNIDNCIKNVQLCKTQDELNKEIIRALQETSDALGILADAQSKESVKANQVLLQ